MQVAKKTFAKKPSDLDIDRKIVDIMIEAHDELRAIFFDAIQTGNFIKADAILSKVTGIQNFVKDQYGNWLEYRVFYEYLSGSSIYNNKNEILNFLNDATLATIREEGRDFVSATLGLQHAEAIDSLLRESQYTAFSVFDNIGKNMSWQLGEYFRVSVMEQLAKGVATGDGLQRQKQKIIDVIKDGGVSAFTDRAGRKRSLPRYADMLVRTETARAYNQGTINRGLELGITHYEVNERADCCPICQPHRGKIYNVTDGGVALPPYHPNCRGFVSPRPDIED